MNPITTWNEMFNLLKDFEEREGHCNIPFFHIEDGKNLSTWLYTQRAQKKRGELDAFCEKRLEDVGIVWDVFSECWEDGYRLLVKFQQREGHLNVPTRHIEGGARLGQWLNQQRQRKKKGTLDKSIEQPLEDLGVAWNFYSELWEKNYLLLIKFRKREGHSNVPSSHIEGSTSLGMWLDLQRQKKKRGKLDKRCEKKLKDVGIVWQLLSERWENYYRLLLKFQQREGHSNVPSKHKEDGTRLGTWLCRQAQKKKKGTLDGSREKKLVDVGVVWDITSEQWEEKYRLLVNFQQREGHLIVPQKQIEDGVNLGVWLTQQRRKKKMGKLDSSCKRRLDEIGFVWAFTPHYI